MRPEGIREPAEWWRRLAVAAWVAVLLAVCGRVLVSGRHSVYPIFADAGRSWLHGSELYPETCRPGLKDRFRYSPAVAALFAPFSLLPDRLGECLWRVLNAAVYLGAFAWWCGIAFPRRGAGERGKQAALWLLLLPLSVGSLNNGQSNPLVAGLLVAAVAGAARERWNLAAACVTVACLFKGYPLAIGLLLAAVYPRQFALRLVVALVAGWALPLLLQAPEYVARAYAGWLRIVGADDRTAVSVVNGYRDLWQLFRLAQLPVSRGVYVGLQLASAAAVAALCVAGRAAGWPRERLLAALLGLGSCWMMLCGPATESCTYIMLAPALAWAVVEGRQAGQAWPARHLPAAAFALLTLASVACWFPAGKAVHGLGIQPLAALLLTAGLVAEFLGVRRLDMRGCAKPCS